MRSYMRVQFKRLGLSQTTASQFNEELDIVAVHLPSASSRIATLRRAWSDPDVDVSDVLPFNYI